MTREQAIQYQIDEAMDEFDFRKVAEYMESVNWGWHSSDDKPPSEYHLRKSVRRTMQTLAHHGGSEYCGGFFVEMVENKDNKWIRFQILFTIESVIQDGLEYKNEDPN